MLSARWLGCPAPHGFLQCSKGSSYIALPCFYRPSMHRPAHSPSSRNPTLHAIAMLGPRMLSCRRPSCGNSMAFRTATSSSSSSVAASAAASGAPAGGALSSSVGLSSAFSSSLSVPIIVALPGSAPPAAGGQQPHVSVLLDEVLEAFAPLQLKVYVDCTLGAGGHATAIAQAHPEMERLVGIDLDPAAHAIAQERIAAALQRPGLMTSFVHSNYSNVEGSLLGLPGGSLFGQVDGMLMDLGVSSMQLDTAERGFSFLRDGPIDMRMDPGAALSAEQILNTYSEAQLGRMIREYGEEKSWRTVARRIVEAREQQTIKTTQQLAQVVGWTQFAGKGKKSGSKQIHPATRTFQALRIAVNDELVKLEQALPAAIRALRPGGRLAVISFHSLEDRIVKHAFMRAAGRPTPDQEHMTYGDQKYDFLDDLERNAIAKLVTRKPLTATDGEISVNSRSRSAKLRVIERKGGRQLKQPQTSTSGRSLPLQNIEVLPTSDGRGNGAFTTSAIAKGAYICDYEGELLNQAQYFDRYPDGTSDFVTEVDEEWHIDASQLVSSTSSFSAVHMNHSRSRHNVLRTKLPAVKRVSFHAARDISGGEELLYDYGGKYWAGREGEERP